MRSQYASGNVEKAIELFRFYEDASSGVVLDVQDVLSTSVSTSSDVTASIAVSPSRSRSPVPSAEISPITSISGSPVATSSLSSNTLTLVPSDLRLPQSVSRVSLDSVGKAPLMPMKGADNLNNVTCYMDSLLFAMYARLDVFEPILYKLQDNAQVRNLSTLIRLWVNLLRSGKLITTDITAQLRSAIADCGWAEAGFDQQQDASELFVFITEKLSMPLLTLKMDIAHGGKEVADDDHKFINERVLHVPIGGLPNDPPLRLEECLEDYFANSVLVRREIERRRSLSVSSIGKQSAIGIEYAEFPDGRLRRSGTIDARPEVLARARIGSVEASSPVSPTPSRYRDLVPDFRGFSLGDESAVSLTSTSSQPIISENEISSENVQRDPAGSAHSLPSPRPASISSQSAWSSHFSNRRRSTLRTINNEISLPAWTFLQLLPFYTDSAPHSTSASHFGQKRPVLPICLKRYSWTSSGKAIRNNRKILIPEVIEFPHFVADDVKADNEQGDALYGNFRLVLEAAVCHRGNSLESGHYVSIVRDSIFRRRQKQMQQQNLDTASTDDGSSSIGDALSGDNWLMFDDLATPKIKSTTFYDAIANEVPYLLFYRMVHIDEPIEIDYSSLSGKLEPVISSTHSVPADLSSSDEGTQATDNDAESSELDESSSTPTFGSSRAEISGDRGRKEDDSVFSHQDLQPKHKKAGSVMIGELKHKGWSKRDREKNMGRKQSVVSMPGGSTVDPAATDAAHHRHRYRGRLHRRKGVHVSEEDSFDEEDRCIIS